MLCNLPEGYAVVMWQHHHSGVPETPVLAVALHSGHHVRPELRPKLILGEADRLREEDPFTDEWTLIVPDRIVVQRSRFEVDLSRPRSGCVYRSPKEAWGLRVWRTPLTASEIEESRSLHDDFFAYLRCTCLTLIERFERFVVLDLHSYNHQRDGVYSAPAEPARNPEVNVGTGSLDRALWAPVVEGFIHSLRQHDFLGRHLDVRENVRFQGGFLGQWIHDHFPRQGCVLAVHVKKFFMDEWTGKPDWDQIAAMRQALASTVPRLIELLGEQPSVPRAAVEARGRTS